MRDPLRKYGGPKGQVDAARDVNTRAEELRLLTASEHVFVRSAAAANPGTPEEAFELIIERETAGEPNWQVLAALARNPSLTPRHANRLAALLQRFGERFEPRDYYPQSFVEALFGNSAAPIESLRAVLDDPRTPKHVRGRIASAVEREDVLRALSIDASGRVQRTAVRRLAELGLGGADPTDDPPPRSPPGRG